jgi:dTDP-4-dehydrorhamnose reductase
VRILVAGAQGQLARALREAAATVGDVAVTVAGRPTLDVTDAASIARALDAAAPDLVVNAAAYTAVDKAETEVEAALAINRHGAGALAQAAAERICPIIHVSSDYVFDGEKAEPYTESDPTNPLGAYGRSKLAGELAVAAANPHHIVLRTAWLYDASGHNFLNTILRLAKARPQLDVVADQHGSPTYAPHLARAILVIARQLERGAGPPAWGIYHATSRGETTWHGFASAIVASGAARLGTPRVRVLPITAAQYPLPARRPANSRLDCSKLACAFGVRLPTWQQGLAACFARLAPVQPAPREMACSG